MNKIVWRLVTIILLICMMLSNLSIVGTISVSAQTNEDYSSGSLIFQETIEPTVDDTLEVPTEVPLPTETPVVPAPTDVFLEPETPVIPAPTDVFLVSETPEVTATETILEPTETEMVPVAPTMEIPTVASSTDVPSITPSMEVPSATPTTENSTLTLTPDLSPTVTSTNTGTPEFSSMGVFVDCSTISEIPLNECQALAALYASTNGTNWTNHTDWKVTDSPCSWFGVTCASGHVIQLNLENNGLSGSIPTGLGNLPNLNLLALNGNNLTGTIPSDLTGIIGLQYLELYNNNLNGNLPDLGTLTNLKNIEINNNPQMSGILPVSLKNITGLQKLYFGQTGLCGPDDPEFQNWLSTIPDKSGTTICSTGTISGKVTAADGITPLNNVQVFVSTYDGEVEAGSFRTASDGLYTIGNLPPGNYRAIVVNYDGYSLQYYNQTIDWFAATQIHVTAGSITSNIDFALPAGGTISGKVFGPDNVPLANINVSLNTPLGGVDQCTKSDGSYSFNSVPFNTDYRVSAALGDNPCLNGPKMYSQQFWNLVDTWTAVTPLSLSASNPIQSNIDFKLKQAGTITGTVTAATGGGPLAGIEVCSETFDSRENRKCSTTEANGVYTISSLAAGDYRLSVNETGYEWQYYNNTVIYGSAARVTVVSGGTKSGINFVLKTGGTISGTVYGADGTTRLPNMNVRLDGDGYGNDACTDENGNFSFNTIPFNANFKVRVAPNGLTNWCQNNAPGEYVQQYWHGVNSQNEASVLRLTETSPTTAGINFVMRPGGRISGTVAAAADGTFLSGINVCVQSYDAGIDLGCATTDSSGGYKTEILPIDDYRVRIFASGWAWQYFDHTLEWGNAARVTVTNSVTTSGINFALERGGTISGTVFAANGTTPLPNTIVVLDATTGSSGTCTNAQGKYSFDNAPTGLDLRVRAAPGDWGNFCTNVSNTYAQQYWKYVDTYSAATIIRANATTPLTGINFNLHQGGTIKGRVTDSLGNGLANIKVNLDSDFGFGTCTDSEGNYQFVGIDHNIAWRVQAAPTDQYCNGNIHTFAQKYWNNVSSWGNATTITITPTHLLFENINFALSTGGQITGRVTDKTSGNPLQGIPVCAANYDTAEGIGCFNTGSDGVYTTAGLENGKYRLSVQQDGLAIQFYDQVMNYGKATPVTVAAGAITSGIDFSLSPGGIIRGRLTDSQGKGLANINLSIDDGDNLSVGSCSDSNGYYSFTTAPFDVDIRLSASGGSNWCQNWIQNTYAQKYWNNADVYNLATPIRLTTTNPLVENIDLTLKLGGTITGLVRNSSGSAIPGAWVGIQIFGTNTWVDWIQTGTDGRYSRNVLPPGDYHVIVYADGYALQHYNNSNSWNDITRVPVTSGVTTSGINFVLSSGGTIKGTVFDSDGITPLVNIPVWIGDSDSRMGEGVCTDSAGKYFSNSIPLNKDIRVVVSPSGISNYCTGAATNTLPQQYWQNSIDKTHATIIRLSTAGEIISGIDFTMKPAGTITGTVTKANDNSPLAGIPVCIFTFENDVSKGCFSTDAVGVYTGTNLPAGDYRVYVDHPGWASEFYDHTNARGNATPVTVTAGANTSGINFSLTPGGTISGTVVKADGITPVSNLNMELAWGEAGNSHGCTDVNGNFSFQSAPIDTPIYVMGAVAENWCAGGSSAYNPQYFPASESRNTATTITLTSTSPNVSGINFVMSLDTTVPDVPGLIKPVNGKAFDNPTEFSWTAVTDASAYQFQYDNNADFSSPVISITQTGTSFTPAVMTVGKYYWRVRTRDIAGNWGAYSASRIMYINPLAPVLALPAENADTVGTPAFSWVVASGATAYQFQYNNVADFESPAYTSAVLIVTSHTPPLMVLGTYHWRVSARDAAGNWGPWSSGRTINILAKVGPTLTAPAAEALVHATPTFTWAALTGSNAYQFEVGTTTDGKIGTFKSIHLSAVLTTTSYKPPAIAGSLDGYYWHVRARDAAGNWTNWSELRKINVYSAILAGPTSLTPSAGAVVNTREPAFSWLNVAGAKQYVVHISRSATFVLSDPDIRLRTPGLGVLSYTANDPALPGDGVWYWRVAAVNDTDEQGGWSTTRILNVDTAAPAAPVLSAPAVNAIVHATPAFSWGAPVGANAYQFEYGTSNDGSETNFVSVYVSGVLTTTTVTPPAIVSSLDGYYWHVKARDAAGNWGAYSGLRKIMVYAAVLAGPTNLTPAAGAYVNTREPVFSWVNVPGAKKYVIQLSRSAAFVSTDPDLRLRSLVDGVREYTANDPALPGDGVWYWRVATINGTDEQGAWSTARILNVDTAAPVAPVLSAPAVNAIVHATPAFTWAATMDANAYQFEYGTSSDGSDTNFISVYVSGILPTTNITPPTIPSSLDGYYWRVKARDAAGNWGPYSGLRKINVYATVLAGPTNLTPAAGAYVNTREPVFSWVNVPGAKKYVVQLSRSAAFVSTDPELLLRSLVDGVREYTANDPALAGDGVWYWRVATINGTEEQGAWSAARILNVDTAAPIAPVLSNPAINATVHVTPAFSWAASVGANAYQFEYGKSSDGTDVNFVSVYASGILTTTSITPPAISSSLDAYYWHVKARDAAGNWGAYSGLRKITVYATILAGPSNLTPAANAYVNSHEPVFSWVNVPGAKKYVIHLSRSATFVSSDPELRFRSLDDGVAEYKANDPALSGDGVWYWRVAAVNDTNEQGAWSTTRILNVDTAAPAAPVLSAPAINAIVHATPAFTWAASTGANAYQFEYGTSTDGSDTKFVSAYISGVLATTSITPPAILSSLDGYYWHVKARDAAGNWGPFSSLRKINVYAAMLAGPTNLTPAAGAYVNSREPVFSWVNVAGAKQYIVQISRSASFTSSDPEIRLRTPGWGVINYTANDPALSGDGVWYWRVATVNGTDEQGAWSTARILNVDTSAPSAPVLSAPAINATVHATPAFSWAASVGANAYQFEYGKSSDGSDANFLAIYVSGVLATTSITPPAIPSSLDAYYWHVKARDTAGNWGSYSGLRKINVYAAILAGPTNLTPAAGAYANTREPVFSWVNVTGAKKYVIQLSRSATFASSDPEIRLRSLVDGALDYTAKDPALSGDGVWYWRVAAVNGTGEQGAWSTARILNVDTAAPIAPVLSIPAINTTVHATPTFSWAASVGANAYQFEYGTSSDGSDANFASIYISGILTTTSITPPSIPSSLDAYYWHVKARDVAGNWGAYSGLRKITVYATVLAGPTNMTPAAGAVINTREPVFSWVNVAGAKKYAIQIARTATFAATDPTLRQKTLDDGKSSYTTNDPALSGDGVWYWRVATMNGTNEVGAWSTARILNVDTAAPIAPLLNTPADNLVSNNNKPAFSWQASVSAIRYQVQFDDNPDLSSPETSGELTSTSFTPLSALPSGLNYWQVRAKDAAGNWGLWSPARKITIDVTPPDVPVLIGPISGQVTNDTTPYILWATAATASGYQFRYDNDANFSSPVHISPTMNTTSYTPPVMAAGTFFWQVRAIDLAGNWSAWSEAQLITIDTTPPPVPALVTPVNNATTIYPIFTWSSSSGATGYQIQYDGQSTFSAPIDYTADEENTSHTTTKLIPAGVYYWRVRAADEAGNWSTWSSAWKITIPG